ncbi:MAG: outer membrane beta-barrel protein [Chitinophagales bacterium]
MKNIIFKFNIALLLLVGTASNIFAQQPSTYNLGITGGTMLYYGDLTDEYPQIKNYTEPAYGLQLERRLTPKTSLRLSASKGQIRYNDRTINNKGELLADNPNFDRALNFQTDIKDAALAFVFQGGKHRSFFRPYVSVGFGITQFDVFGDLLNVEGVAYNFEENPDLEQDENFETDLRELDIEGENYDKTTWHIPVGLGLQFRLAPRIHFNLETNLKYAFSDHLDDVSSRGNDNGWNDIYAYTQAGLVFSFGSKKTKNAYKAPKIIVGEYAVKASTSNPNTTPNMSTPPADASVTASTLPTTIPSTPTIDPITEAETNIPTTSQPLAPNETVKTKPNKTEKKAAKTANKNCMDACDQLTTKAEKKACKKQCKAAKKADIPPVTPPSTAPVASNETTVSTNNTSLPNPQNPSTSTPNASTPNVNPSKDCEDVELLKAQLAALQLEMVQLKQNPQTTSANTDSQTGYDPVVELYKLEADRLREDNSNTKIIHEIQGLRNEIADLKNNAVASNNIPMPNPNTVSTLPSSTTPIPTTQQPTTILPTSEVVDTAANTQKTTTTTPSPNLQNETKQQLIEEEVVSEDVKIEETTRKNTYALPFPTNTQTDSTNTENKQQTTESLPTTTAKEKLKTRVKIENSRTTEQGKTKEVTPPTSMETEQGAIIQKTTEGEGMIVKPKVDVEEDCCEDAKEDKKKFNPFGIFKKKDKETKASKQKVKKEKKKFNPFGIFKKKDK